MINRFVLTVEALVVAILFTRVTHVIRINSWLVVRAIFIRLLNILKLIAIVNLPQVR